MSAHAARHRTLSENQLASGSPLDWDHLTLLLQCELHLGPHTRIFWSTRLFDAGTPGQ